MASAGFCWSYTSQQACTDDDVFAAVTLAGCRLSDQAFIHPTTGRSFAAHDVLSIHSSTAPRGFRIRQLLPKPPA
ncbi:hypothetical protein NUU61_004394 [Penicillium alfredii]|uniref:Uncharacterized protein n=1 Tax=Penicillium alfredii TaxID=1506179 RepID=A0A9W9FLH2_9EURO|nr:uncharacterized protein NUU61_004394 [Penicillium alfredii]KAJ5102172.1 hypothetical protein NUU61_004394 [Penicillium alfredii]